MRLPHVFAIIISFVLLLMSLSGVAMTVYKVKSGDSLWRIARANPVKGFATKDIIKAIKGINAKNYPSINDNMLNVNQKLTLPTTVSEVKDGIQLFTLRHTRYLEKNSQMRKQNTHTKVVSAKSAPAGKITAPQTPQPKTTADNIQNNTERKPTDTAASKTMPTQNNGMTNQLHTTQTSGKIISKPKTSDDQPPASQTNTPTQSLSSYGLDWFILIVIVIIIVLIWRSRVKRQSQEVSTKQMKDQFYHDKLTETRSEIDTDDTLHPDSEKKTTELDSILKKADQLIAHNDITQAKAALQEALNIEPKNIGIRIKLLSVYGADADEISFKSEKDYLAAHFLPYDDPRWKEIDAMQRKFFLVR